MFTGKILLSACVGCNLAMDGGISIKWRVVRMKQVCSSKVKVTYRGQKDFKMAMDGETFR